jgi:nitroimidazol reductase NimA-like FMN-containing flavoprotein (pyridoxamine 5'-phosphate oxidase superfamily)
MSYRSVIGQGTAKWVEEPGEKARALAALVRKYSGQGDVEIPTGGLHGVAVIRIALGSMTGKLSTGS